LHVTGQQLRVPDPDQAAAGQCFAGGMIPPPVPPPGPVETNSGLPSGVVAAAELRRRGLALCKPDPDSKSPRYTGWPTRSLEPADFNPHDQYGIVAGPLSDGNRPGHALVILDLDAAEAAEAVEKADQFLPETGLMEGKPGKLRDHRYFLVPLDSIPDWARSPAEQAAPAAKAAKGHPGPFKKAFDHAQTKKRLIDFIGTGGQAVCPSPANQRRWEGGVPGEPAIVPFAMLLDATCRLAEACGGIVPPFAQEPLRSLTVRAEPDRVSRARAYVAKRAEAISGQDGHGALWAVALDLVKGFDLSDAEARPILEEYKGRCQPPWSGNDLAHKLKSARASSLPRGYHLNKEGASQTSSATTEPEPWLPPIPLATVPHVEPFPVDVLPRQLARFVQDAAAAISCPPDYIAVPMLVLGGSALGAGRALEVKPGYTERACLYAVVIGPPGTAKTPALKLAAAPVYQRQARLMQEYRQAKDLYDEQDGDRRGKPPKPATIYVSDTTTEKLAEVLQDNLRGVSLIRDELSAWVGGMDQYRARGRGSDRQFFLSAWGGEPVSVHRKNQQAGPIYVVHPFIAVGGGIQPDLLANFRGEHHAADGFLDRLLFAYPEPPRAVGETWACVPDAAIRAWSETLRLLYALEPETEVDGGKRPHFVRLTSDGRAAWKRFTEHLAAEMNADSFPEALRGPWSKMRA
jgi:hypothetical protein